MLQQWLEFDFVQNKCFLILFRK